MKKRMKDSAQLRDKRLRVRVTPEERDIIYRKMDQYGGKNLSAYLRKMALDGYVISFDPSEVKALSSRLQRYNNNLNQILKKISTDEPDYGKELKEIQNGQRELTEATDKIVSAFAKLG